MKTTLKLRKAIRRAISQGMCEAIDRICPEIKDNPPDTWDEDTRRRFDLITEVETCIAAHVDVTLNL